MKTVGFGPGFGGGCSVIGLEREWLCFARLGATLLQAVACPCLICPWGNKDACGPLVALDCLVG